MNLMKNGKTPPQPSNVGDLWFNTENKMVYSKISNETWVSCDLDGDIIDEISEVEEKDDTISDWDRAMSIL